MENRNTMVIKDMLSQLENLKMELADLESQSRGMYIKPQFLIDDDDEYQEALEMSYEKSDLNDRIETLKERIWDIEAELRDQMR